MAGGGNGVDWYDSVMRFDCATGLMHGWRELAPLAVARGSLAAAMAGGYLFCYGGGKPAEQYDVVEWCAGLLGGGEGWGLAPGLVALRTRC